MKPTVLRTPRLLLRPFRMSDADDVYAYASDPEWSRYLPNVPDRYTRDSAIGFLERATNLDWSDRAV